MELAIKQLSDRIRNREIALSQLKNDLESSVKEVKICTTSIKATEKEIKQIKEAIKKLKE